MFPSRGREVSSFPFVQEALSTPASKYELTSLSFAVRSSRIEASYQVNKYCQRNKTESMVFCCLNCLLFPALNNYWVQNINNASVEKLKHIGDRGQIVSEPWLKEESSTVGIQKD